MKTHKKIRIAVFDDNLFFRESMRLLFEDKADFNLTGVFEDAKNVLRDIKKSSPDVVLMDIEMPGRNGIDAVKVLKKKYPELPVMMLTDYDDDDKIIDSICAGADGYNLKKTSGDKLIGGIKDVCDGHANFCPPVARKVLYLFSGKFGETLETKKFNLTARERDVLRELVKGHSYKVIAHNLGVTYDTVRAHIKHIYGKLQVSSISGAVAKAIKQNIVS